MEYSGIDRESLMLAIQLQHQDLDESERSKKGKHRADEIIGSDVAHERCRHEPENRDLLASDCALCLRLARDVKQDAPPVAGAEIGKDQAANDHDSTWGLSGGPNVTPTSDSVKLNEKKRPADDLDDASMEAFKLVKRSRPDHAECSSSTASRKRPETRECIACTDRFPPSALLRSPCSHEYCRECLLRLVQSSFCDESLFPPRCCGQNIPVRRGTWFSPSLVIKFLEKQLEFSTTNRTYCSDPSCSEFVMPVFITNGAAWCHFCDQRTCVHCKGPYHEDICQSDGASQQLLELAAQNGWQRCYACQRIVELDDGCNHMTCRCKAEFCYACGEPWKTCNCPQWHEERLVGRANAIVDRDDDAGRVNEVVRQHRVEQERLNLIENHECTHERWERRRGSHQYEECLDVLPLFLYKCRQCRIMACRRCRYNRL